MPRPERLLVLTVGVQWLVTAVVATWATRTGSVYGDPAAGQAAIAAAHGVANGVLPSAGGPLYSLVLAPLARLTTSLSTVSSIVTAIDVLVLAPIASYCLLEIGRRIGGRLFAIAAVAAWLLGPIAAVPLFADKYHDTYVDNVLPAFYGLTVQPAYPAMTVSLVAALFALRGTRDAPRAAFVAGLAAGAAIGLAPMDAGVAVGVLLALAVARRWQGLGEAAVGLGAALVPTTVWRYRAPDTPTITLGHPSWVAFQAAMANVREFFWSNRLLQWLPVAGAIGMFRLLRPGVALAAGWFAITTVLWIATSPTFDGGAFFIGVIPSWPAYALLVAAIPGIVPTLLRRLGPRVAADESNPQAVSRAAALAGLLLVVVVPTLLATALGRL